VQKHWAYRLLGKVWVSIPYWSLPFGWVYMNNTTLGLMNIFVEHDISKFPQCGFDVHENNRTTLYIRDIMLFSISIEDIIHTRIKFPQPLQPA
jgi:hypothetical protein